MKHKFPSKIRLIHIGLSEKLKNLQEKCIRCSESKIFEYIKLGIQRFLFICIAFLFAFSLLVCIPLIIKKMVNIL
jgi:hypothetical protein